MQVETRVFTVSELTMYISDILESIPDLQWVTVEGEISNWSPWRNRYVFFTLKDERAILNCVIFNINDLNMKDLGDGVLVRATGRIRVYPQKGQYQLQCEKIEVVSKLGRLYKLYHELKEKLRREGLFEKVKKPIPPFPRKIAVVTSRDGAAIRDVINTISRRYPLVELRLYHTAVQGEGAKYEIVRALTLADSDDVDIIILARGGGSFEDLWPFNEEMVVRKVYSLRHPVITGVGHEVDFTLVDFVADLRAPTPTGAAERSVPDMRELLKHLDTMFEKAGNNLMRKLQDMDRRFENMRKMLRVQHPSKKLERRLEDCDRFLKMLESSVNRKLDKTLWDLETLWMETLKGDPSDRIEKMEESLGTLSGVLREKIGGRIRDMEHGMTLIKEKLKNVDPRGPLRKGYVLVRRAGKIVRRVHVLEQDDNIELNFHDGVAEAVVRKVGDRRTEV
ncbi:MAG: exodeoxyribonuclease VII large subunit [Thermotogae bacterium]|nr:exodeoxyribonuclease VII large subunit [Thermotogota bacterium]